MESALLLFGILLSSLGIISPISAQRLPDIACPQFFEYLSYNQQFIGHIAVRHDPQYETNELVVEFSQYGAYQWSYVGSLTIMDNQEVTKSRIANGEPVNYRVDFPIPSDPPKLTKITLNNEVLCIASQYPPPKTAISLRHSLLSTTVPLAFLDSRLAQNGIRQQWQLGPSVQFVKQPDYTIPEIQVPAPRTTPKPRPVIRQQTELNSRVNPKAEPLDQTLTTVCGRERAVTTPLIFQGEQLQRGQLPWLVGLFERDTDNGLIFFCGGSLISSKSVLSAAHCFRLPGRDLPADRAVVSLGRNTIDIISEGELREVAQLLFHDAYEAFSANADMVLIRLAKKVIFNDYIVPICLWNENYPLQLPSGYKTYVAGWGADENGNVNTQFAKITDTNIVSESDCLRESVRSLVQPNTICAKRVGAGPCASDGGGGLMLRENNIWLLRGVISLGLQKNNTCDLNRPSLYTDVAKHIAWLRQNMWE